MSWLPDWVTGFDADNAQRAADADAYLRADNERKGRGTTLIQDKLAGKEGVEVHANTVEGQRQEIDAAFEEGLQDGANNITGFVSGVFKFVGKAISAVLFGIPAWAWLLGIGAVWVYLGMPGLKALKKKLA